MNPPATYTPGHSESVSAFMARRTVETHGAFVLPHLRPDWRILDLGCGPGTITLGLAARVPHGSVLGLDMNAGQIERARSLARERGVPNVSFEVGTVETVTLPAGGFDLVFAHAVLEHLGAPVDLLRRLRGCLRPGGLVALRSPEWGGFVLEPSSREVESAMTAYERLQQGNGGNLRAGRKLAAWLGQAGFGRVLRSASYEIYADPALIATYLAAQLEAAGHADAGAALRAWGAQPGAMFAQAWFEAIGGDEECHVIRDTSSGAPSGGCA